MYRPLQAFAATILFAFGAETARADFSPEKLALIDRPFIGDQITLSPDGHSVAYTVQINDRCILYIVDIDRKTIKSIPVAAVQRTDRAFRPLATLRWVPGNRLILQNADGEIVAIDADGRNATLLWSRSDNGIVNDYENVTRFAGAGPPRILPLLPEAPDTLFVESSALLGLDRLANLYAVNVRTGFGKIANKDAYYAPGKQFALYGPGDKIGLPNLPPDSPFPVHPESSSTGIMLYDKNGWPRILYETSLEKRVMRRFSYTATGNQPSEPNLIPISLEETLGLRTYWQELRGKVGEFEIRPANYFGERSYPIGFGYDPDVVYLASSVGRDTYGIFSLNLKTKERVEIAPEVKGYDLAPMEPAQSGGVLVFDEARKQLAGIRYTGLRPRTYWLDPELRDLQATVEQLLPKYGVEIVSWDTERKRFILRATSEDDPGGIFIFDSAAKRLELFTGRAPWLAETALKPSASFAFDTPAGVHLTGYLTLPTDAKVDPPPLLIYCAAGLWDRAEPGFNREAEMLADMGMVVMRLNYRGSAGFGRAHLTAIQEGIDTVPVEDLIAAVEWLTARRPIDRKRVVVMGEGFGGYLALQAMQHHPEVFRAAIGLNAPTNLRAWATRREATSNQVTGFMDVIPADVEARGTPGIAATGPVVYDFRTLVREAFVKDAKRGDADISEAVSQGNFRKPVLLISEPHSSDLTPLSSLLGALGLGLEGTTVRRISIRGAFVGGSFDTRSKVFRGIEEFLNLSLFDYDTEIGDLKEVKTPAAKK